MHVYMYQILQICKCPHICPYQVGRDPAVWKCMRVPSNLTKAQVLTPSLKPLFQGMERVWGVSQVSYVTLVTFCSSTDLDSRNRKSQNDPHNSPFIIYNNNANLTSNNPFLHCPLNFRDLSSYCRSHTRTSRECCARRLHPHGPSQVRSLKFGTRSPKVPTL